MCRWWWDKARIQCRKQGWCAAAIAFHRYTAPLEHIYRAVEPGQNDTAIGGKHSAAGATRHHCLMHVLELFRCCTGMYYKGFASQCRMVFEVSELCWKPFLQVGLVMAISAE